MITRATLFEILLTIKKKKKTFVSPTTLLFVVNVHRAQAEQNQKYSQNLNSYLTINQLWVRSEGNPPRGSCKLHGIITCVLLIVRLPLLTTLNQRGRSFNHSDHSVLNTRNRLYCTCVM